MRSIGVWFLGSWVAGIIAGAVGLPFVLVSMFGGGILFFEAIRKTTLPVSVVVFILVCCGWWWGDYHVFVNGFSECIGENSSSISGVVQSVFRLENSLAQYVVHTDNDCNLLVFTSRFPEHSPGNILKLEGGKYENISNISDEYEGYRQYLAQKHIDATLRYPSVETVDNRTTYVGALRNTIRQRISFLFSEPEAGLLRGMILDDRGGIEDSINDLFLRSGVNHIISISGLHLSLIASIVVLSLAPLSLHPYIRTGLTIGILWIYVFVVGLPVAAVRATVFWTLTLLAFRLHSLVSLATIFFVTVGTFVTVFPAVIFDIGFQLSFAAVLGIGSMLFLIQPLEFSKYPFIQNFIAGIFVSLGAMLATAPIGIWHFQTLSIYSIIANIGIVPLSSILLILAGIAVAFSFIALPVAFTVSYMGHLVWQIIAGIAFRVGHLPGAYQEGVSITWWMFVGYYVVIGISIGVIMRFQKRSWREIWQ